MKKQLLILIFFTSLNLFSQNGIKLGFGSGFGKIQSDSPSVSSIQILFSSNYYFSKSNFGLGLVYILQRDSDFYLPWNERGIYFSYLNIASANISYKSYEMSDFPFIAQVGLALIEDKIYKGRKSISYGINFDFEFIVLKLAKNIMLSFGANYGFTFQTPNPTYTAIFTKLNFDVY